MFSVVTLFVHLYITQTVELDIRSSLSRQVTSLSENIVGDDGTFRIDESKIEKKYPDMYIVILDENGTVVWGSPPDGVPIDRKRSLAPAKVTTEEHSYYYIDRYIRYNVPDNGYVRAYVSEQDVLGNYIPIRLTAYGGTTAVFAILTAVMLYALQHFRRSIKAMEMSVARIGTSRLSDEYMEESGHYTEINSLIQANNRMLDRMNEMFDQQEQFSSDVAHELKTPIAVIKAQSQYALHNMLLSDEEKKSFEVILKQSQKMQDLVMTLLMLSRLESGDREDMQERIDLTEIVSAVCETEEYRMPDRRIRFEITDSGASETSGNIDLVTIAVTNLITNAVKFNRDDSVIEVETGEKDDFVFVKVKDNGIGMTANEEAKVFTRLFKSDSARNSSGYGLGMPIALKIAKKHGGTIEVESKLGKGSCFTMYLAKNN